MPKAYIWSYIVFGIDRICGGYKVANNRIFNAYFISSMLMCITQSIICASSPFSYFFRFVIHSIQFLPYTKVHRDQQGQTNM